MTKKIFQVLILCGFPVSMSEAMSQDKTPSFPPPSVPNCTTACGALESFCTEKDSLQLDFSNVNNYCTDQINTTFDKYATVSCDKIQTDLSSIKVPQTLMKLDCHKVNDICMKHCIDNIIKP